MTEPLRPAILNSETLRDHYPAGVNWDIPLEKITLVELFDRAVSKYADHPCIDFFGRKISYRQLDEMTSRAAKGFQEMGVTKGTRVGFYMPNTLWHPVLFFGALKAGAIIVNYSTQYVESELEHQVNDSGTTILVTADTPKPDTYKNATSLLKKTGLKKVLVFNLDDAMPRDRSWLPASLKWGLPLVRIVNRVKNLFNFSAHGKVKYLDDFLRNDGKFETVATAPDDTAVLQYTGGTSGRPKGAELTHYNLTANVQQIAEFIGDGPGKPDNNFIMKAGQSKMYAPLPFFHVFGMTATMLTPLHLGMETILTLDPRDLETSLKIIERTRPDASAAVPKLVEVALKSPLRDKHDHSSIKAIVTGGAAMPTGIHKQIHEECSLRIFPGYGLTETAPVLTVNPLAEGNPLRSAGKPIPGVEIRICDAADPAKILSVGEDGEIQARGPNIMKGYLNNPEATREVMVEDPDGKGAWFRTGDVGRVSEDGHLFITDRLKRMINVMGTGKKVWSSEIEDKIMLHPDVLECVVVAVNKGTEKEAAKAFVRPKEGKTLDEAALTKFLEGYFSKIEIPRKFEFVAEPLPVTAIGKPDWKKLEDMEAAKSKQQLAAIATAAPAP